MSNSWCILLFLLAILELSTYTCSKIQIKVYGSLALTAYYYTDIFIGLPRPQRQSVIVDTGSNLLAFVCTDCEKCGHHIDPYYDPRKSLTSMVVPCKPYCRYCVDNGNQCAYDITYMEGSHLSGRYFEDFVSVRNENHGNSVSIPYAIGLSTVFGGITRETSLFYSQAASGILGLAYSKVTKGRDPFFQSWSKRSKWIGNPILSMCFSTEGGMLAFGGYNSEYWLDDNKSYRTLNQSFNSEGFTSYFTLDYIKRFLSYAFYTNYIDKNSKSSDINGDFNSKINWTPMTIINGNYYVELHGISILNTPINFPKDDLGGNKTLNIIVDSGTTLTYFPVPIFNQIIKGINDNIATSGKSQYSPWRKLVETGSSLLQFAGLINENKYVLNQDLSIKSITIFPGEVPGAALLRKRVFVRNLSIIQNLVDLDSSKSEEINKDRPKNLGDRNTTVFESVVNQEEDIERGKVKIEDGTHLYSKIGSSFEKKSNSESSTIRNNTSETSNFNSSNTIEPLVSRIMLETTRGEKCWRLNNIEEMHRFPTLTLHFSRNVNVKWEPQQYLYQKYRNTYCLGFDSDRVGNIFLGSSFFLDKDVILDIENSRAAFVQAKCPRIADARRTSTAEMAQLLNGTLKSPLEAIRHSEVVVFDSKDKYSTTRSQYPTGTFKSTSNSGKSLMNTGSAKSHGFRQGISELNVNDYVLENSNNTIGHIPENSDKKGSLNNTLDYEDKLSEIPIFLFSNSSSLNINEYLISNSKASSTSKTSGCKASTPSLSTWSLLGYFILLYWYLSVNKYE
ncbi:aspartyl protease family protein [Cryptosporidium andersoni]|uniref:Aspartyl protease family protein n=1 Tax=Cryptosporidium andersoni TaxID=117008 RepID=A0A1J4MIX1_9CRYT|nr:aspartyl protease family protein [Cryptosporidium andersoni]